MKIVIIEDEYPAAERLEKLIRKAEPTANVVQVLDSVEAARRWFATEPAVDLIFSDIQLSDGLSFQIFDQWPTHRPVVFTTSYDEYAIRAFRVKSIDYLLKPIKLPELAAALTKYHTLKQDFSPQAYAQKFDALLDSLSSGRQRYKTRFLVRQGEQLIPIAEDAVAYFYTANELACLVAQDGRQHLIDYTLEELESQLNPLLFFRLNRQFIARLSSIRKIHQHFNGKLKLELQPPPVPDVLVSREKAGAFKTWLDS